ncbi:MAG: RIO1 family regulatory kinase/ATPase [Nanoarchaeota archaeon]|nr:RIO1 family regulatory kinase/ATPase [Nanoarchaeota archaeon]
MEKDRKYSPLFDRNTGENISRLINSGLINEISGPIGSGKEANIFYTEDDFGRASAIKIHRHNINTFKSIPEYLKLRGKRAGGFIKIIDEWTRYEYETLKRAYSAGVKCPEPYGRSGNVIVMQFIGSDKRPAEMAVKSGSFDVDRWYKEIIDDIIKLAKRGIIHGDLSPYNILNFNGEPYIIDFSQALKLSSATRQYLIRDIRNINDWFRRLGLETMKEEQILEMIINEKGNEGL